MNSNKKRIVTILILLALVMLTVFLLFPKKSVENIDKTTFSSTQEFLVTFPDPNEPSLDSKSPDDVVGTVLANFVANNSITPCGLKEDGSKYEATDKEGYRDLSRSVDLNGDGVDELLVMPIEVCGYVIRGASGNGPIYIYQKKDASWVNIGELLGNQLRVKFDKTNNYYNLETNYHMSVNSGVTSLYEFNLEEGGEGVGSYKQVNATEYAE